MVNESWVIREIERLGKAIENAAVKTVGEGLSLSSDGELSTTKHVFSITPEIGTGITATPNHKVFVEKDSSYTVTFAAEEGYKISRILIDGEELVDTEITSYTFSSIEDDHIIELVAEQCPIYGFILSGTVSNPANCITFIDASASMTASERKEKTYSWIKPTVVGADAKIAYDLDREDLSKKADGTTANIDGTDGDVCASIQTLWMKFTPMVGGYIKAQICEHKFPGSFTAHLFDGTVREWIHIGMFEATGSTVNSVYSTALNPTANTSMKTFRTQANTKNTEALGEKLYGVETFLTHTMVETLFIHAYGTLDSQTAVGPGFTNSGNNASTKVARADLLTCGGEYAGTNTTQCMALYLANYWGNVWEFKDGCMWQDAQFSLAADQADIFDIELGWGVRPKTWHTFASGIGTAASASYVKNVAGDEYAPFFPNALGGDSASYLTDACWSSTGARVCLSGGYWDNAALAGLFTLAVGNAPSDAFAHIGARLQILNAR